MNPMTLGQRQVAPRAAGTSERIGRGSDKECSISPQVNKSIFASMFSDTRGTVVQAMAPLIKQAHDLKTLWTREGFPALSRLFLDQLTNEPGAYNFFLDNGFSQLSEAFAALIRQQMAEQQAHGQF